MLSDMWLSRCELLENFNPEIPHFEHVLDPVAHPWTWTLWSDGMKGRLTSQGTYGASMMPSDKWLSRYRLQENFNVDISRSDDIITFPTT